MNDLDPIQDLLNNPEQALEVYLSIPEDSMYMRINRGWGMFYLLKDAEQVEKLVNHPHRYVRYSEAWIPLLSMRGDWAEFSAVNGLFDVADFKHAFAQAHPIDALGISKAWEVVQLKPITATHYNSVSGKFQRMGMGEHTEMYTLQNDMGHWSETAHLNEHINERFIDLEKLSKDLYSLSIALNCAV